MPFKEKEKKKKKHPTIDGSPKAKMTTSNYKPGVNLINNPLFQALGV